MTALIATGGAILTAFSFVLALIAGLIAWKFGSPGRRKAATGTITASPAGDRLEELRHDLDLELRGAADAVAAIPPGSAVDRLSTHLSVRLAACTVRIGHWVRRLPPHEAAGTEGEQVRELGLAIIHLQSGAVAAARHPDDELLAGALNAAMDDLDRAIRGLTSGSPHEVVRVSFLNRRPSRPGEAR